MRARQYKNQNFNNNILICLRKKRGTNILRSPLFFIAEDKAYTVVAFPIINFIPIPITKPIKAIDIKA